MAVGGRMVVAAVEDDVLDGGCGGDCAWWVVSVVSVVCGHLGLVWMGLRVAVVGGSRWLRVVVGYCWVVLRVVAGGSSGECVVTLAFRKATAASRFASISSRILSFRSVNSCSSPSCAGSKLITCKSNHKTHKT